MGVPNTFVAEWLQKRLPSLVKDTLGKLIGEKVEVRFSLQCLPSPLPLSPLLDPRYTFDTFVIGSCNRLAHSVALEVVQNLGQTFNPLCLHSGTGLGKTHLLQAIASYAQERSLNWLYVGAEQFTNEYITAIQQNRTPEFRDRYRHVDMLLMDDLHFLSGKKQTQESFLHTFNELYSSRKQIVVASDRPPSALALQEGLCSRFQGGLAVELQTPDLETRLRILKAKADRLQILASPGVLDFLARQSPGNIRQLEGYLYRVLAETKLKGCPISLDQAMGVMEGKQLSPPLIVEAVAQHFQILPQAIYSRRRDSQTTLARRLAIYLLREELCLPLAQIAALLGLAKPSVIYAYNKITQTLRQPSPLDNTLAAIKSSLATLPTAP